MIYNWTSQFEAYPAAMDFGSVTDLALRRIKGAFGERFSEGHYLDELVGAECYHLLGKSTVIEVVDEAPSTNLVEGAVQQYGGLYYDNGITMDGATPGDHSDLINADAIDHPQYIKRNDIAGFVEITGPINFSGVNELSGMQETYTAPDTKEAVSRGQHIGADGGGGSKHLDNALEMANGDKIGHAKFKVGSGTVTEAVGTTDWVDVTFVDYCFLPFITAAAGSGLELGCIKTNIAGYTGRIAIRALSGSGNWTFKYYYLDA